MKPFGKSDDIRVHVPVESIIPHLNYVGAHKKGIEIAEFYGFRLLRPVKVGNDDKEARGPSEHVAFMRNYLEQGLDACTQPPQLCHTIKVPYKPEIQLRLEVLGTKNPISEALLIHTTIAILKEYGFKNLVVNINSVGGKESYENFTRELTAYYRKHMNDLDTHCRQALKENLFEVFDCVNEKCLEIIAGAPQPVAFLTEASKQHFFEVLEHLEGLGVPYKIDSTLVGQKDLTTRTVFSINTQSGSGKKAKIINLAGGERYDRLAKQVGLSRKIPAAGITIEFPQTKESTNANIGHGMPKEKITEYKVNTRKKPKAYVIHIGSNAKLAVLNITEELRHASIPIAVSFVEDRFGEQLFLAESIKTPSIVIIGQKEMVENTAIVRNTTNRSQVTIPQSKLSSYLRRTNV